MHIGRFRHPCLSRHLCIHAHRRTHPRFNEVPLILKLRQHLGLSACGLDPFLQRGQCEQRADVVSVHRIQRHGIGVKSQRHRRKHRIRDSKSAEQKITRARKMPTAIVPNRGNTINLPMSLRPGRTDFPSPSGLIYAHMFIRNKGIRIKHAVY